jgi:hypothetical protein
MTEEHIIEINGELCRIIGIYTDESGMLEPVSSPSDATIIICQRLKDQRPDGITQTYLCHKIKAGDLTEATKQ